MHFVRQLYHIRRHILNLKIQNWTARMVVKPTVIQRSYGQCIGCIQNAYLFSFLV